LVIESRSGVRRGRNGLSRHSGQTGGTDHIATLTIPEGVQRYFPAQIDPSQLWVNYNAKVDSLTIYFTGKPVPSVWTDVDAFAYIGFAVENKTFVTGLMIEHFSKWLLVSSQAQRQLQPA
jgi:hypothetical protein